MKRDHHLRGSTHVPLLLVAAALGATLFVSGAIAQTAIEDVPPPVDDDESGSEVPPPEAVPPTNAPSQSTFEEYLAPYGTWVDTPDQGRVWSPSGTGPNWQPYTDGRWVDTEWGWSFASTVPWGWAVFHYGRWGFGPRLGWYWVPDFVWGPAWVSWRYSPGFICWSPFAPTGFGFGRHWPGWVVLPAQHFRRPVGRHLYPQAQAAPILHSARPVGSIGSRRVHGGFGTQSAFPGGGNFRGGGRTFGGSGTFHRATPPGGRGIHRSLFRGFGPFPQGNAFHSTKPFQRSNVYSGRAYRSGTEYPGNRAFHGGSTLRGGGNVGGGARAFSGAVFSRGQASGGFARRR